MGSQEQTVCIETAQNVNIAYKPAGLVLRIGATLIDLLLLGGIFLLCLLIALQSALLKSLTASIVLLVVLMCYHLVCEYFFRGQSIGKQVLHLRVVRLDGQKLTFWDCLLRWSLRLIDISASMGIFAMLSIILSSKMQRLGDLAAGTTVIQESRMSDFNRPHLYDLPEDYEVHFPQVALLSDKDMSIIREVFETFQKNKEYALLESLSNRIKVSTGIETDMNQQQFIETVIKDYIRLTQ